MPENITKSDVELIAGRVAETAIEKHTRMLPALMKPVIFEVAEIVTERQRNDYQRLLSNILGGDVADIKDVRDIQADFYHLRQQRTSSLNAQQAVRSEVIRGSIKWVMGGVAALVAFFTYHRGP